MNLTSFLAKKGQYSRLVYRRAIKTKAGCTDFVEKEVEMVARAGISYSNMAAAPETTGPLPWGQWIPGHENYLIQHKGSIYVRVAPQSAKSRYFVNGVEVSRDAALTNALASEKKESEPLVINVNLDNVKELS